MHLPELEELYLWSCHALRKLPESIGGLTALKTLYLQRCTALTALPRSLRRLQAMLHVLELRNCDNLRERGEGESLGWRELREIFGNRVVLDSDRLNGPEAFVPKEVVYAELDSQPLSICREALKDFLIQEELLPKTIKHDLLELDHASLEGTWQASEPQKFLEKARLFFDLAPAEAYGLCFAGLTLKGAEEMLKALGLLNENLKEDRP